MAKGATGSIGHLSRAAPTLRELTAQRLRQAILSGQFKPGERLVQQDLCARTGVSRTCVREALQQLETEGLVERAPDKGHVVGSVGAEEARQIYEVRGALEPTMARLFVQRADAQQVAALRAAHKRIEEAIAGGLLNRYVEELAAFYAVLLQGARNEIGRRFLETLNARITYLRRVTAERATAERRAGTAALLGMIVAAAEAHDVTAIAERCLEMVQRSAQFAMAVIKEMEAEARAGPAQDAGRGAGGRPAA